LSSHFFSICRANGETIAAKEALIKWSRGLAAMPWKQEAEAFEAYADATLRLSGLFLDAAAAGNASTQCVPSDRDRKASSISGITVLTKLTPRGGGCAACSRMLPLPARPPFKDC